MNILSSKPFQKGINLALCLVLLVSMSSVALAKDNQASMYDFLVEGPSRGNSPPTATTTLPYTGSGVSMSSYVFSNYKFKPNSNGTITMRFTGTINTGTATITVYLCNASNNADVASWSLGNGSSWSNVSPSPNPFTGLNPNTYYYFRLVKSNSSTTNTLNNYTLVCS